MGAENLALNGIRSRTVQPVACRYTDCAIPTHGENRMYIYIVNTQLTLRLLMEHLFLMFLDHTQRRSTVGRTPLDE